MSERTRRILAEVLHQRNHPRNGVNSNDLATSRRGCRCWVEVGRRVPVALPWAPPRRAPSWCSCSCASEPIETDRGSSCAAATALQPKASAPCCSPLPGRERASVVAESSAYGMSVELVGVFLAECRGVPIGLDPAPWHGPSTSPSYWVGSRPGHRPGAVGESFLLGLGPAPGSPRNRHPRRGHVPRADSRPSERP